MSSQLYPKLYGPPSEAPSRRERQYRWSGARPYCFKRDIEDVVLRPGFVIEVPPFLFQNHEALGFHGGAQHFAQPSGFGAAALVRREGPFRKLIVSARHRDFRASRKLTEGQVHCAAAIVFGALRWVGDKSDVSLLLRRRVPKRLCHGPGPVSIKHQ